MCRSLRTFILPGLCLLATPAAQAQWVQEQRLLAGDGVANDYYGWSVDVRAGVAVVGAWGDDDAGGGSGSAYVYRYDAGSETWTQEQKLTAADAEGGDNFGWAVAVDGDVVLVGAGFEDTNGSGAGAAYIFRHQAGGWVQEQKLTASDGTPMDRFGHAVDIEGDVAVVGAAQDDDLAEYAGSAYVFRRDSASGLWVEEQKLTASDGVYADNLGAAVSISGDVILLGAETDDQGLDSGSAYVFRFDPGTGNWVQEQKLFAANGAAFDLFGGAVSVDGDVALIGAERDTELGVPMGSASIFRYSPGSGLWTEQQELLPSDGAAFDNFGFSVALSGDAALVGAFVSDDGAPDAGSAYLFRYDGGSGVWTEEQEFRASTAAASDYFGGSVALDGDVALVGADHVDALGEDAGAAYVFRWQDPSPIEPGGPSRFALSQNSPNPFDGATVIAYELPIATRVRLAVYDVLGRQVAVLVDGAQAAGYHTVTWDAGALPTGPYIYRVEAGAHRAARSLSLTR